MKRLVISFILISLFGVFHSLGQNSEIKGNAQIYTNQQTVTATATALASQVLKTICIKALHANTAVLYIGNSGVTTANGMELAADQSWCAAVVNANQIYIIGTTGSVSWIGTN